MEEITAKFTVPSGEDEEIVKATFNIETSPTKLSELEDNINLDSRFSVLTNEINTLKTSEDTEMTDIVALIERRTENMIDLLDE